VGCGKRRKSKTGKEEESIVAVRGRNAASMVGSKSQEDRRMREKSVGKGGTEAKG